MSCVEQTEMADAERVLALEEQELREERGKQDRLATSITDQMHAEAQVGEREASRTAWLPASLTRCMLRLR